jgi:hypothetical protein
MRAAKTIFLGISMFCVILPTQVLAEYKCWNPAICKAVCGSEICGKLSANNRDMKALDLSKKRASGQIAASSSGSSSGSNSKKTYTCSNPAICIAVCGKKTCL